MSIEEHAEINEELVCQHLCDVTDEKTAWILLQEPGFIGFGAVYQDKIYWPPCVQQLDWARIRDLRLFGEKGEWHVWQRWNGGWKSRLLELENIDDALTEYHVLWGTWPPEPGQPPWMKLVEARGTEIWLPIADSQLAKKDFPLRLKLKQVVGCDNESKESSHLVGIIDAALVALVDSSCKKVFTSAASLSCKESETAE